MTGPTQPFSAVNAATATLASNLGREGRSVFVSPVEGFGTLIPAGDWAYLGLHPVAERVAPTTNVERAVITAQDPNGGPPITLTEDITDISAVYESIAVLTPDDVVRALHIGSVPMALTGDLAGGTISPFAPGAGVQARMIVIRRRQATAANPDPLVKVYWHPRVSIQNNSEGDDQDRETLVFRVPVQAYLGGYSEALSAYEAKFDPMGAIFTIPASKLDALLAVLDGEALA